jgi:uncharacterized RDD family membrane protein YckC
MIDNRFAFETPEGTDILLTPAGLGPRTMAFVIDMLIRGCIIAAAATVLGLIGNFGTGVYFLILFIVEWFYPVLFEIYKGSTPGKQMYGLVVVYDNGLPISLPGSLLRNLFRSIDILPFAYLTGLISIICSERFKRLGDYVAGTMVVYHEKPLKITELQLSGAPKINLNMSLLEQQAVIAFAERSDKLSQDRQRELANNLSGYLGCKDEEAVLKIKSIAANLLGKA